MKPSKNQTIAIFSLCLACTMTTSCVPEAAAMGGMVGGLIAQRSGASSWERTLLPGIGAAVGGIIAQVIEERQANARELEAARTACQRQGRSSGYSYYHTGTQNGQSQVIRYDHSTKKVSSKVQKLNKSVRSGEKVTINNVVGEVVYG